MGSAAPPATLAISHDLRWSLTVDPADPASLRLAQYRSSAPDPEGSIELPAGDIPLIRNWLRGVLRAAEWPSDREFAGAGILQMIPRPRPELYLERLSPGRGRFGPGNSLPRDASDQPRAYQRLCLYEPDIRLIVNWLSAWSEKLHGEDSQNWIVEERPPLTSEERAAEDDFWDSTDDPTDPTDPRVHYHLLPDLRSRGAAHHALGSIQESSDEDDQEDGPNELGAGTGAMPELAQDPNSQSNVSNPRDGLGAHPSVFELMLARRIDPERNFSLKEVREIAEWARQEGEDRIKTPILIVLYLFGLPLLALWLWGLAKQVVRSLF